MDAENKNISISVFPLRRIFPSGFGKTYSREILKKKFVSQSYPTSSNGRMYRLKIIKILGSKIKPK